MKNKLLVIIGLVFYPYAYGSEIDSDIESISSQLSEARDSKPALVYEEGHVSGSSSSSSSGSSSDDSSSESSKSDDSGDSGIVHDKVIDKTWGLKNLLSSTPDQDLQRSPLLGLVAVGNGTIKKWYGTFTDVPVETQEAGKPARNKRVFTSETSLEKVTRAFFDILDNRVRCSAAGSNPMIALSPDMIGELVILTHEQGISGTIAFLEKGLVRKQKQKKQSALSEDVKQVLPEESFINEWWTSYKTRPEKGKFTEERDFRKRLMPLFKDLKELEQEQGPEKSKKNFLTLLMAFLVLKDEAEGQKDSAYALQDYFKKLGVVYTRDYYTTLEKKAIQKRLTKRSFGTSVKDFEAVVFYLVALAKNDFEFINASAASAFFKEIVRGEERQVSHALCAEVAVRSLINLMLYNPITQRFDSKMLPERIHLDPLVYDFYFNSEHSRTDPQMPRYYADSLNAWIQVIVALHKKFPEIVYRQNELAANPQNMLLVFNRIFGMTAQSFQELGNALSKDGSQITIETAELEQKLGQTYKKEKWTIVVERDGLPGEDPYEFFANLELSSGHASFDLAMENIMPLMDKNQYRLIEGLQKLYGVDVWSMVLNPAAINAVINDETPFQEAIDTDYMPLVELLIKHGADIHQVNDDGETPFQEAIETGCMPLVELLIKHGADIHQVNDDGETPFQEAMENGYMPLVELLIKHGADIHQLNDDGEYPLHEAIENGYMPLVELLIKHGADIHQVDNSGMGALFYAYKSGNSEMVKFFTDKGLTLNVPLNTDISDIRDFMYGEKDSISEEFFEKLCGFDRNDRSDEWVQFYSKVLVVVLENDWVEYAKKLIQEGANINFIDAFDDEGVVGLNAPIVGAARGCTDEAFVNSLVDALEPAGNDKNKATVYGQALGDFFIKKYNYAARVLIEKGANTSFYGEYPNADSALPSTVYGIVFSVSCGDDKRLMQVVVDKLSSAGENKALARLYGQALYQALSKKWFDIAKILIEKGADTNWSSSYESDGATGVYGVVLSASYGNDKQLMQTIMDRLTPAGENTLISRLYGEALYQVIAKQWFDIARILIQKGADVNFYEKHADHPSTDFYRVVLSASSSSDKELMEMIVQKLDPVGTNEAVARMYGKALYRVIYNNWFDLAAQLVKKGAILDELTKDRLKCVVNRVEYDHDKEAGHLLQAIGTAKKSDAWAQMYKETLRSQASFFGKTEDWLKLYGASLEQEVQSIEGAIKNDVSKLEEIFGEEQRIATEPSEIVVHSEKIPASMEKPFKVGDIRR